MRRSMTEFGHHLSILSLHLLPFITGEALPAAFSTPRLIVLFVQSSYSPAFLTSLLTRSSHLRIDLPSLLLLCSRNSAALFGSLSSVILSTCPAHRSLLLTRLSLSSSSAFMFVPLTPTFFSCVPSLLLLFVVLWYLFSHTVERRKAHSSLSSNIPTFSLATLLVCGHGDTYYKNAAR